MLVLCHWFSMLYVYIYISISLCPNGGWLIKTGQYSCSPSSYIFEYQHLLQYLADLHWLVMTCVSIISNLYNPESLKSDTKQCAQDELWHQPCKPSTSAPSARRARARPLMLGCWAAGPRWPEKNRNDGQLKEAGSQGYMRTWTISWLRAVFLAFFRLI